MTKRCIGIDIGRSHVRAVQVARTPEGFLVEKTFGMQTRRRTDSPPDILRSLANERGFDRRANIVVSLPHHAVFFAETETEAAGLQALREGETSALKDDFPIPADEAIAQVCSTRKSPSGKYTVLVAATSDELLREELRLLAEARMRPAAVDTPITAVRTAVAFNHPEMAKGTALILCVDESTLSLIVTQDASILIVRNIPVPLPQDYSIELLVEQFTDVIEREVEITWRKLFGTDPDKSLRVFLVSAPKTARHLAAAIEDRIECQPVVVNPYANVGRSDGADADVPVCVAEGLALRTLSADPTDRVDFLAAYNARIRPGWNIRRELMLCVGLLVMMAAVWFIGLFLQRSLLESEYARLKEQIRDVFHQAMPEEKNIGNPLAQLRQKLDTFQEDYELFASFRPGRLSPLEVLQALSTHTPVGGNLKLGDLLITPDSVGAVGSCDSFATLSEWQHLLEEIPGFDIVDIQNQKKDAQTAKVHFTLSMSSARTEQ